MTAELIPAGPRLWCVTCDDTRSMVEHVLGDFTCYRCGTCGMWAQCPRCMAVRSAAHTCKPGGE